MPGNTLWNYRAPGSGHLKHDKHVHSLPGRVRSLVENKNRNIKTGHGKDGTGIPGIPQRQVRCSWDTILTPRSIQESGWFSGIQTRTLVRTPDTDRLTLRGNEGRESSDDRGVSHIHHTSINPHTAIIGFLTTFKRTQIIQTTCDGEWHENLDTQHEGLGGARH